ncbi:putative ankyrin repeat protein [Botrytis fragariae]|uniref:Putative ankyrin repeat protein n=1 Tax=Botrytis fragariae TaxID=1964551 RepID=A0A8H6B4L3_9HELO|nr:putative ankyrin repeat protein [Botrytis fragariae]KAF5879326.1 putative ankyrin repeat protein [Botrytis fragariae]
MAGTNTQSLQRQQRQRQRQQIMIQARRQQMQMMAAQKQQKEQQKNAMKANINSNSSDSSSIHFQSQSQTMGTAHDDIPFQPADMIFTNIGITNSKSDIVNAYEAACRNGSLSTVQSIIRAESRTPYFLNHGLNLALRNGNGEVVRYLLSSGAPIARVTPAQILSAPSSQRTPLFELLFEFSWTPNTPGFYGQVLLPELVTNISLLRWFLSHGANPNLGAQRLHHARFGDPEINSCATLESSAAKADVKTVRLLLEHGAKIENGYPLHYAAGSCPPGTNPHVALVTPSTEFDIGRIPVMELLVSRGADVNQKEESRYMVPGYPIVYAVMAGAVERVRWLLDRGANPELRGSYGSAVSYVEVMGSEEMRCVVAEGLRAGKWLKDEKEVGSSQRSWVN